MLEPEGRQPRKELADALRSLRKAAGLSGERLSARCSISQSKISRIERGKLLPSVIDVERILTALDVPPEVARDLVGLARKANVDYKSWRTYAQMGLWRKQAQLKSLTESSILVRQFLPAIPSGLIQVEDYARQTLTPSVAGNPARDIERAVRTRMEAQEVLHDESRQFIFLLTEQAVRWRRAPRKVMSAECAHLAKIAQQSNVDVAIIPLTAEILAAPLNIFIIYDDRLVLVELFSGEVVLRDPQDIDYHSNLFDFFMSYALTGDDATTFLRSLADEFMREPD